MLRKIIFNKKLYALVIEKENRLKNSKFFTPDDCMLQAGFFIRKKGFLELPHYHKKIKRSISRVEQFLYILKGSLEISFYNKDSRFLGKEVVNKSEGILLISGIHSLKAIEDVRAVSVKQGPFLGNDNDKILMEVK